MFFQTVEFYVICAFIAGAIVAYAAIPSRRGPVRGYLYGGTLLRDTEPSEPRISLEVRPDGLVTLTRDGLEGISESGAWSLALEINGFDITIRERLTPGRGGQTVYSAYAVIDALGAERFHFQYISEATSLRTAFTLTLLPGNKITRPLTV